jgi:hypothetical protein
MTYRRLAAQLAAAWLLTAAPASAQEAASPPVPAETQPAPATSACCSVPARTTLEIEILDTLSSKDNSNGQSFRFRLAEPLAVGGRVLVPTGTEGVGEVVHAARARAMGKAGELILAARYLQHGDTRIPLRTLRFGRNQGRDNSGTVNTIAVASAGTVPVVGMVGYFISGGEVRVPAGTRATAQTAAELALAPAN